MTFLTVLSSDTGVDCDPSTSDGMLGSPSADGGYLISGFLDIRNLPELVPIPKELLKLEVVPRPEVASRLEVLPNVMCTLANLDSANPYKFFT